MRYGFYDIPSGDCSSACSRWKHEFPYYDASYLCCDVFLCPQQKKQKEIAKFRNELKKGDKIVTIGGIYGTVDEIREKYVIIVVDGDVKLRVDKSAIVKDMSDVPAK